MLNVRISGSRALFTNPLLSVERYSHPVITPTAAAGVLESIYWKPEIQWEVQSIKIISDFWPQRISFVRNEIKSKIPKRGKRLDVSSDRTQRMSSILLNVDYIVQFKCLVLKPKDATKHYEVAKRRISKGQYFRPPYLGCSEYSATVTLPTGQEQVCDYLLNRDIELGAMVKRMVFQEGQKPQREIFHPIIRNGVIECISSY